MFEFDPQALGIMAMLESAAQSSPAWGVIRGPGGMYHIRRSDDTVEELAVGDGRILERFREQGLVRDHHFDFSTGRALPATAEHVPQRLTEAGLYVKGEWTRRHYGVAGLEPRDVAVVVFLRVPSVDDRDARARAEAGVCALLDMSTGHARDLEWITDRDGTVHRMEVHGVLSMDQAVRDRALEIKPSALPYRLT